MNINPVDLVSKTSHTSDVPNDEQIIRDEIASLSGILSGGSVTTEKLHELLDRLEQMLDDPEYKKVLSEHGVTRESIEELREGLDDPSKFESSDWQSMFGKLDSASEQGKFSRSSLVMLQFMDYALGVETDNLEELALKQERDADITELKNRIDKLIEESDGPVELTPEIVADLRKLDIDPSEIEDPKLRKIIEGGSAEGVKFDHAELENISSNIEDLALNSVEGSEKAILIKLRKLENERIELATYISSINNKMHDEKMKMADKIGGS